MRLNKNSSVVAIQLLLALLGLSAPARAETDSVVLPGTEALTSPSGKEIPTSYLHQLLGHDFLRTSLVESPFADSRADVILGTGYGDYPAPIPIFGEDLKLVSLAPSILGQVQLIPKLALSFGMNAVVVAGINANAAIQYGATTSYSLTLGLLYELIRSESTVFSVGLDVLRPHSYAVSPLAGVYSSVQDVAGVVSGTDAVSSSIDTQWRPSLRVAHAFNSVFGVQGILGFNVNQNNSGTNSPTADKLNLGFDLEADLDEAFHVPIGLTGGYRRGQVVTSGALNADIWAFGISETFRDAFNATFEYGRGTISGIDSNLFSIGIRTYFK